MTDFLFTAPSFFDANATSAGSDTVYEDAPSAGEALAKFKRLAFWLHGELIKKRMPIGEPIHDEGGYWLMSVPARKGFALISVSSGKEPNEKFTVSTTEIGSAAAEHRKARRALESVLRESNAVSNLEIRP
jgi:hypothetical protein